MTGEFLAPQQPTRTVTEKAILARKRKTPGLGQSPRGSGFYDRPPHLLSLVRPSALTICLVRQVIYPPSRGKSIFAPGIAITRTTSKGYTDRRACPCVDEDTASGTGSR